MDTNRHIERARAAISAVLEDLERQTGRQVQSIEIRDLDITTISDPSPTVGTSVVITLAPPKVRKWI